MLCSPFGVWVGENLKGKKLQKIHDISRREHNTTLFVVLIVVVSVVKPDPNSANTVGAVVCCWWLMRRAGIISEAGDLPYSTG
jgi:hypothetical protein